MVETVVATGFLFPMERLDALSNNTLSLGSYGGIDKLSFFFIVLSLSYRLICTLVYYIAFTCTCTTNSINFCCIQILKVASCNVTYIVMFYNKENI